MDVRRSLRGPANRVGKDGLIETETTHDGQPVYRGNDPNMMPGPETTYQSYGVPWANLSNTPFREYKHWVHEGGIATPLIAHWTNRIQASGRAAASAGSTSRYYGDLP